MIPIARPDIGPEEVAAVTDVLTSGMIAQGKRVAEFEARWAEACGVRHAIAVSNGTVALMSVFAGLGLGPGDEVITVSHTFAATANAILYTGATPVFVDIERDTYLIDAARIEAAAAGVVAEAAANPDAYSARSRSSLERMSQRLQKWNKDGKHDATLARLQEKMTPSCSSESLSPADRSDCEALFAPAKGA